MTEKAGIEKEIKRRADVVGIFPNETSILRLIGAVLLEANDAWQLRHRYMQLEAMAELLTPELGTLKLPPTGLGPVPRRDVGRADRAA